MLIKADGVRSFVGGGLYDEHQVEQVKETMFTWINVIQDTRVGLPKVYFDKMKKIPEM